MMQYRRSPNRRRPRPHRPLAAPMPTVQPGGVRNAEPMEPMRALTLIYHEDFEPEITGIIQRKMLVARYTKVRDVQGARADIMQDTDFTPHGQNNMLIIVATQQVVLELAESLRELRLIRGHGLRGYITPVEGLI